MEAAEVPQDLSTWARAVGVYFVPGDGLPVTGFGVPHCNKSSAYDRIVVGWPRACSSTKYTAVGTMRSPIRSSSRYGSHGSPVSTHRPISGSTRAAKSRSETTGSGIAGKASSAPPDLSLSPVQFSQLIHAAVMPAVLSRQAPDAAQATCTALRGPNKGASHAGR